jgi:hypothetical protein
MHVLLYCGVCIGVRLLPPGENPIALRNNNNNNNNNNVLNKYCEYEDDLKWSKCDVLCNKFEHSYDGRFYFDFCYKHNWLTSFEKINKTLYVLADSYMFNTCVKLSLPCTRILYSFTSPKKCFVDSKTDFKERCFNICSTVHHVHVTFQKYHLAHWCCYVLRRLLLTRPNIEGLPNNGYTHKLKIGS